MGGSSTGLCLIAAHQDGGADALRERMRWLDAERRWSGHAKTVPDPGLPPTTPAGALGRGAVLTQSLTHDRRHG